ncbi:MAG: DUF4105 domain-containing protein [Myxococcales bacterium]|nr:MAG: DUF4105 domain-containing protein [Myxococcales bacterium]
MTRHLVFYFCIFYVVNIFSQSFDEVKILHQEFFEAIKNPNNDLENILDAELSNLLRNIKSLGRDHKKNIQREQLSASLGHPKKRKVIFLRGRDVEQTIRPPFKEEKIYNYKFKDTLKSFTLRWASDPQFIKEEPDIAYRLSTFFEIDRWDNNALLEKSMVFYLDRMDFKLRHHLWPVVLHHEKIHSLQLLSMEGGNSLTNAFGHSALRIVMCDPERSEISDECLKDTDFHVVLMFRAEVPPTSHLNPLRAVTGSYPSRLFMTSLNEILDHYLEREKRTIIAIPLELNRDQIVLFTHQLMRIARYDRPYEFFKNNCATELLALLQSVVDDQSIFKHAALSPGGVIKRAQKAQLVKVEWPIKNKSVNNFLQLEDKGLAFVPYEKKLRYFFRNLKVLLSKNDEDILFSRSEFLNNNSQQRIEFYQGVLKNLGSKNIDEYERKVMIFLMEKIEEEIKRRVFKSLNQEGNKFFIEASSKQLLTVNEINFVSSEQNLNEELDKISQSIAHDGNQIVLASVEELRVWEEKQLWMREVLRHNWGMKRLLNNNSNEELNEQEQIIELLKFHASTLNNS